MLRLRKLGKYQITVSAPKSEAVSSFDKPLFLARSILVSRRPMNGTAAEDPSKPGEAAEKTRNYPRLHSTPVSYLFITLKCREAYPIAAVPPVGGDWIRHLPNVFDHT